MFTDLVGFTSLAQSNEPLAMELLEEHRKLVHEKFVEFEGREVKTMGDAFLVEFDSALAATNCAVEIQKKVHDYNRSQAPERKIRIRIGVHVGDVMHSGADVYGDAVNVASRIEPLANPEGVCITEQVYDHVRNKISLRVVRFDFQKLKNVQIPIEVYRLVMPWEEPAAPEPQILDSRRLAILPLTNISPDPKDEYFSDGMTEELISTVSKISELSVISRTSVMRYRGSNKGVSEISQELKVGTVLEGSVRRAGDRVRITVQLIDAPNDKHLWSETYDRQLEDIFAVQSDIAKKIADSLRLRMLQEEKDKLTKGATGNMSAYTLYLKGRYYWNERKEVGIRKGIEYLQKAIQEDPSFALAYSDLADCHVIMADYSMMPAEEALARAVEYATKALELDATVSQAHAALAASYERKFRWADAEAEYKRAIELNPNNATAHHWYALSSFFRGRKELALQEWSKARELDPLSLIIGSAFGYALAYSGRHKEGIDMLKGVLEMNDAFLIAYRNLAFDYIVSGMYTEALETARKLDALDPALPLRCHVAVVYARTGHRAEALKILEEVLEMTKARYVDPVSIAEVHGALGDERSALEWLEKGVREKAAGLLYIAVFPAFESMQNNSRFKEIIKQIRLG
jgi:TolB-like protein/Tfp pilus assembly protein PilF